MPINSNKKIQNNAKVFKKFSHEIINIYIQN